MRTDTDTITGGPTRAAAPTTRQYAYGLAFIGSVLAVIVGFPIWLFVTFNTCGCTIPTDLVVYNADSRPVTVTWRQPGLLGTPILGRSETVEVASCTTGDVGLAVGHDDVTVNSSHNTAGLAVEVPTGHGGYEIPILLVHEGGAIERLPAFLPDDGIPAGGRCGG